MTSGLGGTVIKLYCKSQQKHNPKKHLKP